MSNMIENLNNYILKGKGSQRNWKDKSGHRIEGVFSASSSAGRQECSNCCNIVNETTGEILVIEKLIRSGDEVCRVIHTDLKGENAETKKVATMIEVIQNPNLPLSEDYSPMKLDEDMEIHIYPQIISENGIAKFSHQRYVIDEKVPDKYKCGYSNFLVVSNFFQDRRQPKYDYTGKLESELLKEMTIDTITMVNRALELNTVKEDALLPNEWIAKLEEVRALERGVVTEAGVESEKGL